ncbi:MAG: hypothetical protein WCK83_05740 [Burkholderiales bacterium]|nr:hypothetical protein [Burkholderiales bacterium]
MFLPIKSLRLPLCLVLLLALTGISSCATRGPNMHTPQESATKVSLAVSELGSTLLVNGRPFYIQGAGLEFGSPESLAASGANAMRTWRTENGQVSGREVLDRAWANGLYVAMGLEVGSERHGFNYNDPMAVQRQLEEVKAEILKYKDHPALIIWIIGNELNLRSTNPKVWDAVNGISKLIHDVDKNHVTMTALAGIGKEVAEQIRVRAPDLDLIGIQMYADIVNLPRYIKESGWSRPYLVTEWGATGHWEVPVTEWGAPIENDSTTKADYYRNRFEASIRPDSKQCLGSFVFLWGQKQERTPTWYGLYLESGEKTAAVDVMHTLWKGAVPANQSPRIEGAWLAGKLARQNIHVQTSQIVKAKIKAIDPDQDELTYQWEILEESRDLKDGGDAESRPHALVGLIVNPQQSEITFTAPSTPGAYRLFAYAFDGKGAAAHVNIPFYVDVPLTSP